MDGAGIISAFFGRLFGLDVRQLRGDARSQFMALVDKSILLLLCVRRHSVLAIRN